MPQPSLSIIIVNWNGGELLAKCLDSLHVISDGICCETIVVDNASTDGSHRACEGRPGVRLLRNGANRGFGAACNIGARHARHESLLFLNPDCELAPGSVERALEELSQPDIGVCGVALNDASGQVARSCHRFPTPSNFIRRMLGLHLLSPRLGDGAMDDWAHDQDADVDHVIGAFYAIRRELFERLGGFDERFFVYLEDLDLSLRVRQAGYRVRFLARPASFHVGGGVSRQIKATRLFYATRSRILYAYKHFGRPAAHAHLALTLALEPLTRAAQAVGRLSGRGLAETLGGFAMLWRDLPHLMKQARRP